jgi:hypothetical protein
MRGPSIVVESGLDMWIGQTNVMLFDFYFFHRLVKTLLGMSIRRSTKCVDVIDFITSFWLVDIYVGYKTSIGNDVY